MNRKLKFRVIHGKDNQKIFLDLEKDLIDLKQYEQPIISQFTGYIDDYGSEIYEGDILEIVGNSLSKFHIVYEEDTFIVKCDKSTFSFVDKTYLKKFLLIEQAAMKKKVIGNIFEQ